MGKHGQTINRFAQIENISCGVIRRFFFCDFGKILELDLGSVVWGMVAGTSAVVEKDWWISDSGNMYVAECPRATIDSHFIFVMVILVMLCNFVPFSRRWWSNIPITHAALRTYSTFSLFTMYRRHSNIQITHLLERHQRWHPQSSVHFLPWIGFFAEFSALLIQEPGILWIRPGWKWKSVYPTSIWAGGWTVCVSRQTAYGQWRALWDRNRNHGEQLDKSL